MYVLKYIYLSSVITSFFHDVSKRTSAYLEDSIVYNTRISFRAIDIFKYIYFESIVAFLFICELNILFQKVCVIVLRFDKTSVIFQKP